MKSWHGYVLGIVVAAGLAAPSANAGGHWAVGVNIGAPGYYPGYYRPYYPCYAPYYYRPYPVYVAPPPVIVQSAPVIQTIPAPAPQSVYSPPAETPALLPPPTPEAAQPEVNRHLQLLADADERVRGDSVMQLGRMRARQAIDPLAATLAGDRSPAVRETAARALGLIGSSKALPALQRAAQVDADRDVRRSAQFAMEVIQTRN